MSGHYTDGRRWSYISQAWIFADGWNDREEIARLEAKVRELEEQIRVATAINHAFKQSEETLEATLHTQQDRVHELEDKLRQVEQERDQLRARVGRLEEALLALLAEVNDITVEDRGTRYNSYKEGVALDDLYKAVELAQRALEGKEEHGI